MHIQRRSWKRGRGSYLSWALSPNAHQSRRAAFQSGTSRASQSTRISGGSCWCQDLLPQVSLRCGWDENAQPKGMSRTVTGFVGEGIWGPSSRRPETPLASWPSAPGSALQGVRRLKEGTHTHKSVLPGGFWKQACKLLVKVSEVAQSCPTLCDPVDCSLPGSSVHGIF